MDTYRFYSLAVSGKRAAARDFPCLDDGAAMRLAKNMMVGEAGAEVWQGLRLIGTLSVLHDKGVATPSTPPVTMRPMMVRSRRPAA